MSTKNRVIWREGLFIKPQHFQQQQRHQDYMTVSILNNFFSHFWGFSTLNLSHDLYALGRIGIKELLVLCQTAPFSLYQTKIYYHSLLI